MVRLVTALQSQETATVGSVLAHSPGAEVRPEGPPGGAASHAACGALHAPFVLKMDQGLCKRLMWQTVCVPLSSHCPAPWLGWHCSSHHHSCVCVRALTPSCQGTLLAEGTSRVLTT